MCKIKYFSMIEGSFTDSTALYTVLKLEKMVSGCFGTVGCCNHVYIGIFMQGKQIQIRFSEEFSNTVLCLWELHIALNYTCLWWVRSVVFFVSVLGNISVYSLVIFITLSVLMIFSNLTFLDTEEKESSWSSKSSASSVSRFENHSSRSETGVKRYSKKPRSFSNEVSSNNTKLHFPGQLVESFRLGYIWIYLKPCSSTNVQN